MYCFTLIRKKHQTVNLKMKHLIFFLMLVPCILKAQTNETNSFGVSTNMYVVNNKLPYIDIGLGCPYTYKECRQGKFLLDYGTDTTSIDLYGFPGSRIDSLSNHRYTIYIFQNFFTHYFYDNQDYYSYYFPEGIRQAGIIGTDFLSQYVITLDYQERKVYRGDSTMPIFNRANLKNLGFAAASTRGYFSNDEKKLFDLKLPQKSNNPAIPLFIGDDNNNVQCPAQLDPGYDDDVITKSGKKVSNLININDAYFDALLKKKIIYGLDKSDPILLPNRNSSDTLYKCIFSKKFDIKIVGVNSEIILPQNTLNWNIYLKVSSKEGLAAGGITTFPFPAAQIGASLLTQCSKIIFDPFTSLIWFQQKN